MTDLSFKKKLKYANWNNKRWETWPPTHTNAQTSEALDQGILNKWGVRPGDSKGKASHVAFLIYKDGFHSTSDQCHSHSN